MKRLIPVVVVAAAAALVLALTSCGTSKTHKTSQRDAASALALRSTTLGKVLVDADGRTLYLFEADKPNMSNCSGVCLSLWPALTSHAKPTARDGVVAAKIGTIGGSGGKQQVTYDGHPLYYYAADRKPGDITGQGLDQFGAEWYVLAASGHKIDHD